MAVTVSAFKAQRIEFSRAGDTQIAAAIAEAELEVDPDVWGAKTDTGVSLLTAHKLALSPFGQQAKMVAKDGSTTYGKQHAELVAQVTCGLRVF